MAGGDPSGAEGSEVCLGVFWWLFFLCILWGFHGKASDPTWGARLLSDKPKAENSALGSSATPTALQGDRVVRMAVGIAY